MPDHRGVEITSDAEAYENQMKFLTSWTPKSESFFPCYGAVGLAALAAASGLTFTTHYRHVLRLRTYGLINSYLPTMAIPAASVGVTHSLFVTKDIVLFETPCAVCVNLRSAAIQLGFSIAVPIMMASISNFHLAERKMTYALPNLGQDPRGWLAVWLQLSRPLGRTVGILAALNAAAAAFVTHMEASQFFHIVDQVDAERQRHETDTSRK